MNEKERIIVIVEGGVVCSVTGIPKGVVVEVRDFDTEGGDLKNDDRIKYFDDLGMKEADGKNPDSSPAYVSEWKGE